MIENKNQSGFTLIEMLVAMTMIVTIVSMVYGSYAATSKARDVYDSRLTCSGRAHIVMRLMSRQIRCAYAPTNEPNTTKSTEHTERIQIKENSEIFYGDVRDAHGEFLRFVTTSGLGHTLTTQGGLCRIRYKYDRRAGTLSIDFGPYEKRSPTQPYVPSWRPILHEVTEIKLEFHDGQQWRAQWRDHRAEKLPRAVKITLRLIDASNREHEFSTAIPILCRTKIAPTTLGQKTESAR